MQTVLNKLEVSQPPVSSAARTNLKSAADELVGSVFYGTMLRQLRSATLKGKYGHGGRGEEVFQAQLDQVFAKEMGKGKNGNLSDAIVDRFERNAIHAEQVRTRQQAALVQAQRDMNELARPSAEEMSW